MSSTNNSNFNSPIPLTVPVVTKGDKELREFRMRDIHFMLLTKWDYSAFINSCIGLVFACFVNLLYDAAAAKIPADHSLTDMEIIRKDFFGFLISIALWLTAWGCSKFFLTKRQRLVNDLEEYFR